MSEEVKVIKVEGYLKNLKDYFEDLQQGLRVYKNVTMIDKDGDELFFESLVIPIRNDEEFSNGEHLTFYMSRLKIGDKFVSAVFATDSGKEKRFYPKEAKKEMESVSQNVTGRGRLFGSSPQLFMYAICAWALPIGIFALFLNMSFGVIGDTAVKVFGWLYAISFFWMFWPIFDKRKSGFSEAEAMMKADGFTTSSASVKANGLEKY